MTNSSTPSTIWIVDRDPRRRDALARLAGDEHRSVLGTPEDSVFQSAALPRVVVVGLTRDLESELDFVHRLRARVGTCGWILISEHGERDELERLFDTVEARVLSWPPNANELRRTIRSLEARRSAVPLSQRSGHDALAERFARWFSGDELPWLLPTLDPSLASVPILVRGETGTGRRLLARYIHDFGSQPGATFIPIFCEGVQTLSQLLSQFDLSALCAPGQPMPSAATVWLDEADRLPLALQKQLHGWIDFGVPQSSGLSQVRVRWTASAAPEASERPDRQLETGLGLALSGLVVRLAPLRDQPDAIERFALDTAGAWCEERERRPPEFDREALQALALYPWPGNLRELETLVTRTLARCASATISAADLRFDAEGDPEQSGSEEPSEPNPSSNTSSNPISNAVFEPARASGAGRPLQGLGAQRELSVDAQLEPHEISHLEYSPEAVDGNIEDDLAIPESESDHPPRDEGRRLTDDNWARILHSVAHEVRNPLVSIRTFSELLPEHHADSDFRARFSELVGADVRRIEDVVTRLQELSELSNAKCQPVDIAGLLDDLLEEQRQVIESRQLLVLKELDRSHSTVSGDAQLLRSAFSGIFKRALEWVPERGDLYLASRYRSPKSPNEGDASVRILLRFQGKSGAPYPGEASAAPTLADSTLELVTAHAAIRAQGGSFSFETTDRETVVVVDLPAPPSAATSS